MVRYVAAIALPLAFAACSYRVVEDGRLNGSAVQAMVARTAKVRNLELKRKLPVELLGREALRTELLRAVAESPEREKLKIYELLLKKLGILPPATDLEGMVIDLLSGQIAGYYDPEKKTLRLVEGHTDLGGGFAVLEDILQRDLAGEFLMSHEITHALADQNFDLAQYTSLQGNSDRAAARKAFVEGEAMLVGMHVLLRKPLKRVAYAPAGSLHAAPGETSGAKDEWAGIPAVLKRQILFEYLDGMAFANALYSRGGTRQLDRAYKNPPESSEQILHPEKYLHASDKPIAVSFTAEEPEAMRGLTRVDEDTMGEIGVFALLEDALGEAGARVTAAGWGGDRFRLYRHPEKVDALGFYWRTVWDTRGDQIEFVANLQKALNDQFGQAIDHKGAFRWETTEGTFELREEGERGALFTLVP